MSGKPALKPAEAPPVPEKPRLLQALDLVMDEAVAILSQGRTPRAFQQTEKLIAIARAIRQEAGVSVEDFMDDAECKAAPGIQMGQGAYFGGQNIVLGGGNDGMFRTAHADMQREQRLAELEAVAARRRRDEAETRLALIREFKELSELDLQDKPNEIQEGIEARLAEITDSLRTKTAEPAPTSEPEEQQESA